MSFKVIFFVNIILFSACLSKHRSKRILEEENVKTRVCDKSDKEYIYSGNFDSLSKYVNSLGNKKENLFIVGLIEGNGDILNGIGDFLLGMLAYIVMIALGIISLISIISHIYSILVWPVLWCLCCCKCCCFNKSKKIGLSAYIHYGVSIGLFTGILVSSVIGLTQSTY